MKPKRILLEFEEGVVEITEEGGILDTTGDMGLIWDAYKYAREILDLPRGFKWSEAYKSNNLKEDIKNFKTKYGIK